MSTCVRSYSKINLGLAIGPPRPDGFHSLCTLYQTLALHDLVTVVARPAAKTRILLTSSDPRVPTDARNTVFKMVSRTLTHLAIQAEVRVHIQKTLPIQGGMGAGSANAAAALIGLEKELSLGLSAHDRLDLAARVGSDVPLFLIGGSVLGTDRGQEVAAAPDVAYAGKTEIACVIALPGIGVSTPQAFRDWDLQFASGSRAGTAESGMAEAGTAESGMAEASGTASGLHRLPGLHNLVGHDTVNELSRTYASVFFQKEANSRSGASGILPDPRSDRSNWQNSPEKLHGLSREQRHTTSGLETDLAENSLLALVRTGIENDFERVVFPQYPLLGEIKRHLMGHTASGERDDRSALYAALSGSGSALFGLYASLAGANAAQQRLQQHGVQAIVTSTIPRTPYWGEMFAE